MFRHSRRQHRTDYFRRISENELAGMMVVRGDERRYFFSLKRVLASTPGKSALCPRPYAVLSTITTAEGGCAYTKTASSNFSN
ncbi:DUF4334 domain-containing protein [Agrobacterium genomosp. 13]|uniref:DUF4334 domain-containing protein n=1 Tax=Agrobacterium genomosp. 13 TaxID=1183419 RepID=UPI00111AD62E